MIDDQEPEAVAVWHTASAIGRHSEEPLTGGTVHAWTEPPFGETYYPGEGDPDYDPVRDCPAVPHRFRRSRTHCAACRPCASPLSCDGKPGPIVIEVGPRGRRQRIPTVQASVNSAIHVLL